MSNDRCFGFFSYLFINCLKQEFLVSLSTLYISTVQFEKTKQYSLF